MVSRACRTLEVWCVTQIESKSVTIGLRAYEAKMDADIDRILASSELTPKAHKVIKPKTLKLNREPFLLIYKLILL
ncbi:hypothetical protein G293_04970 [Candidatus Liberibacter africanus PTSAPSY]|uniref:Uncharacterized protein n=1 Tax=Candidatus Liberibacter africanus PTSAPSY TaxID=1277257 RepID=A0A0G3I3Z9_LIBAF|nr:hypothetical protein G293_04970 [Candidatus Liberibacter africanus PTSAPSY]